MNSFFSLQAQQKKASRIAVLGLMAFFATLTFKCEAASVLNDNFDSYTDGQVIYSHCKIQNDVVQTAPYACGYDPGFSTFSAGFGSNIGTGEQTIWFYIDSTASPIPALELAIRHETTNNAQMIVANDSNHLAFFYKKTSGLTSFATSTIELNNWNKFKIEWRTSDDKIRYSLNDTIILDGGNGDGWVAGQFSFGTNDPDSFYGDYISVPGVYLDDMGAEVNNVVTITRPSNGTRTDPLDYFTVDFTAATNTTAVVFDVLTSTNTADLALLGDFDTPNVWHTKSSLAAGFTNPSTLALYPTFAPATSTQYYSMAIMCQTTHNPYSYICDTELDRSPIIDWQINSSLMIGNATSSQDFYVSNVPAFFATTTPSVIYTSLTGIFNVILQPALNILEKFLGYFSSDRAAADGAAAGAGIALLLAYLTQMQTLLGIPFVTIFTVGLVVEIALIVWKQMHRAKKLVA